MGANDAKEQLEVAKAECVRLERELANANERIRARDRAGLGAIFLADAIGLDGVEAEAAAAREVVIAPIRAERDAALAAIEKAPHGPYCKPWRAEDYPDEPEICTCWKSSVDTSALAERDAEKWAEGRRAGLLAMRERMNGEYTLIDGGSSAWGQVSGLLERNAGMDIDPNPYRALAEGGENRGN